MNKKWTAKNPCEYPDSLQGDCLDRVKKASKKDQLAQSRTGTSSDTGEQPAATQLRTHPADALVRENTIVQGQASGAKAAASGRAVVPENASDNATQIVDFIQSQYCQWG